MTIEIDAEIYALMDSLNCDVEVKNDLAIITTPEGEIWTMSEPKREVLDFETIDIYGDIPQ